jgi:site-specific recombinase XerD
MRLLDYESRINTGNHKMITEYLMILEIEQFSMRTVSAYRRILFLFFSEFKGSISDIKFEDVSIWLEKFKLGKAKRTVNQALSALSSFFRFCLTEHYLSKYPIKKSWFFKIPEAMPKYLDKFEHAKVRITAQRLSNIRDKAIAELFDASGIRVGELYGLSIHDINLKDRTAFVLGKGKKERLANFTEYCAFLLEQLIKELPRGNGPLFISQRKDRLSIRAIQHIISKLGVASNLVRNLHPHMYRHTFATDLVNHGADLQVVADELGHEDLATAGIYARILNPEVLSVYRRCMD